MATADILIVILGIRIMFVITLMPPETAKGKIVFLESPSDWAQNTQLEARQHGKTVTAS